MDMQQLIASKNLRPRDVAYKLDVTEVTVKNWLEAKNRPKLFINQTLALCDLLECTLDELNAAIKETFKDK